VQRLFDGQGACDVRADYIPGTHRIDQPAEFWDIALGSGYRATIDALSAAHADALRHRVMTGLQNQAVTELTTDVIYASALRTP
jgi:hypothetical protein